MKYQKCTSQLPNAEGDSFKNTLPDHNCIKKTKTFFISEKLKRDLHLISFD